MADEYPEGRGTSLAGALVEASPHASSTTVANPGSAVPGRVVHCKREPFDVYIGRPSKFGNPWRVVSEASRAHAIERFEAYIRAGIAKDPKGREAIKALYGKTLGCWCAPKACHGDVLLKIAAELHAEAESHGGQR